jgi:hypothetical protein
MASANLGNLANLLNLELPDPRKPRKPPKLAMTPTDGSRQLGIERPVRRRREGSRTGHWQPAGDKRRQVRQNPLKCHALVARLQLH